MSSKKLTTREREVLALIAEGALLKSVADQLGCTKRTAECHSQNMRQKIGAKTLPHAVHIAWQTGLLPAGEGSQHD